MLQLSTSSKRSERTSNHQDVVQAEEMSLPWKLLNITRRLPYFNHLITTGLFLIQNMSERHTANLFIISRFTFCPTELINSKTARVAISFTCYLIDWYTLKGNGCWLRIPNSTTVQTSMYLICNQVSQILFIITIIEKTMNYKTYPVIIEDTNNLKKGFQRASTTTRNWSDGSRPNMPEIVLFIASTVSGATSFWMTLRSRGSISWIKFQSMDFYREPNTS